MTYRELDTVVLTKEIPARALKPGDLGAVVQVYADDAMEVEFVTATGETRAIVRLTAPDVRPVGRSDLLAVRQVDAA